MIADGAPDYGNWIRLRILFGFALAGVLLAGAAAAAGTSAVGWALAVSACAGLGMAAFLAYVRHQLAASYQPALWRLTLDHLSWDGAGGAIDIGTGNGALAVQLAQRCPAGHVTGVDMWGSEWAYDPSACARNADLAGVAGQSTFVRASAAALPFPDGHFDAAVSHFVFHEVRGADPRQVLAEALRVVRPGGAFAFHDMFFDSRRYGSPDALLAQLRSTGVADLRLDATRDLLHVAPLLRSGRVLGHCGILYGRK